MDTIVRPPQAPPDGPIASTAKHRRWPRRVAGIVVALLLLAVVSGAVLVSNVEPLERGSIGYAVLDPHLEVHGYFVDALGVSGRVEKISAQPGLVLRYRFSIRNGGPIAVTITGAGADEPGLVVERRIVAMKPDLDVGRNTSAGFEPFQTFDLPPGDEAGIEMEVRLAEDLCLSSSRGGQTSLSWWFEPIEFQVYGFTRHTSVETGTEIRLVGTRATEAACTAG